MKIKIQVEVEMDVASDLCRDELVENTLEDIGADSIDLYIKDCLDLPIRVARIVLDDPARGINNMLVAAEGSVEDRLGAFIAENFSDTVFEGMEPSDVAIALLKEYKTLAQS